MESKYRIKKYIYITMCLVIVLVGSNNAFSQTNSTKKSILDCISIGGGMGLNFANLHYSDPDLAGYNSSLFGRGSIGYFAEFDITDKISIRPELYFLGRGQLIDDQGIYYRFAATYFDWRLPFIFNFGSKDKIRPYFMLAPTVSFAAGGSIENESFLIDITSASIFPIDIILRSGVGVKVPLKLGQFTLLAGAQVAYDYGIVDTYSLDEKDETANALNRAFYTIDGTRKNRGLEITGSIAIPFSNFKPKKQNKTPKKEFVAEKKVEEKEIIKPCYTVDEINSLIDSKKNVNNKVICMDNLNFEFGKSTLDAESKKYLDNVVTLLKKVPSMKMKISGHTDNVGKEE